MMSPTLKGRGSGYVASRKLMAGFVMREPAKMWIVKKRKESPARSARSASSDREMSGNGKMIRSRMYRRYVV